MLVEAEAKAREFNARAELSGVTAGALDWSRPGSVDGLSLSFEQRAESSSRSCWMSVVRVQSGADAGGTSGLIIHYKTFFARTAC